MQVRINKPRQYSTAFKVFSLIGVDRGRFFVCAEECYFTVFCSYCRVSASFFIESVNVPVIINLIHDILLSGFSRPSRPADGAGNSFGKDVL